VVNSRKLWIVPTVNPDGSEYDVATGAYRSWRKNRQPNSGSSNVGTDLKPQLGLQLGLLWRLVGDHLVRDLPRRGGVLGPGDRGAARLRAQRRIGGVQQIKTNIDFHTYSQSWATNPSGTDTATTGAFERRVPEAADSSGPKQLASTVTRSGAASDVDTACTVASANLTPYAGQSVRIVVEAADATGASLVEAAVDDVKVVQT
jgi:carboxypeptidase T